MVLYFHQYPNEIERWGDLQQLCIQRYVFNENIKWYAEKDYEDFMFYLEEKITQKRFSISLMKRISLMRNSFHHLSELAIM